jgi:hypothetical protein
MNAAKQRARAMAEFRGPARQYPLTADEAAILAIAQYRRAHGVGSFLAKLPRLPCLRRRSKPQPEPAPLDTQGRFS